VTPKQYKNLVFVRKITDEIKCGIYSNYDKGELRARGLIAGPRGFPFITFLGRVALAAYEEKQEKTGPAEVR